MNYQLERQHFTFNEQAFNFWPLYEAIKQYYPVGLAFGEQHDALFNSYPGYQALWQLIVDNIHNRKNFRQRWGTFETQLRQEFKREVEGTTHGMTPSFSAFVLLEKQKAAGMERRKELHFCVSLLGPFYTIYGLDSTSMVLSEEHDEERYARLGIKPAGIPAVHAITTSPYQEYELPFHQLEEKIKARFPGYRMVPFRIHAMILNGLRTNVGQPPNDTLFRALFHDTDQLNVLRTRGSSFYGYNEWRITDQ